MTKRGSKIKKHVKLLVPIIKKSKKKHVSMGKKKPIRKHKKSTRKQKIMYCRERSGQPEQPTQPTQPTQPEQPIQPIRPLKPFPAVNPAHGEHLKQISQIEELERLQNLHNNDIIIPIPDIDSILARIPTRVVVKKSAFGRSYRPTSSSDVRSPTSTSTEVRSPTSTSTEVRSPTSTSTEVRSPTSTSTEVRSPTSTSTEVRSPTNTSTDAYTQGNVTVTGGAGAGATTVYIGEGLPRQLEKRADTNSNKIRSEGSATEMQRMIKGTGASRVKGVNPALMIATSASRPPHPIKNMMKGTNSGSRPKMLIKDLMKAANSGSRPKVPIRTMMKATNSGSRPRIPIPEMMSATNSPRKIMSSEGNREDDRDYDMNEY